jgi:GT2 family glycosyltransferase
VKIDVCIATHLRPAGLQRLLGGLQSQELAEPRPQLRVIVVDNDAAASARELCAAAQLWLRFPLVYAVEKRAGIPYARNAALAHALGHADFAVFIDDDEVPEPGWLAELLRVQRETGADAVAGPVLPRFEAPPPRWVERGRLFERPRHATGTRLASAYTGNLLLRTRAVAELGALFDERLAAIGGSDSEFARRFAARGFRIAWADAAVAHEWIPRDRAQLAWILRRAYRTGVAAAFIDRHSAGARVSAARSALTGLRCIAAGLLRSALALPRGFGCGVAEFRIAVHGFGRACALLGLGARGYR